MIPGVGGCVPERHKKADGRSVVKTTVQNAGGSGRCLGGMEIHTTDIFEEKKWWAYQCINWFTGGNNSTYTIAEKKWGA